VVGGVTGVVDVVVVGVVAVVVGAVVVVRVLVVVGVEVVVAVVVVWVLTGWHCGTTNWLIVFTPLSRFSRSVLLIVLGRFETSITSCLAAFPAAPQFPDANASETRPS
jgi:hypothetical protein